MSTISLLAFVAISATSLLFWHLHRLRRYRLTPGPPGLPIVGNLFNAPKSFEWLAFQAWSRQYGSDVVHFEICGTHFVVLNSAEAADELFDRRSNNFSDRPESTMIELTGWGRTFGVMRYGDEWRTHRRLFHQYFRAPVIPAYHQSSATAVQDFLRSLCRTPSEWRQNIRFMTGSNILRIAYGMELVSAKDHRLSVIEKSNQIFSKIAAPGAYLVDSFPIMKHIPVWLPGGQFKREAAEWKPTVDAMFLLPYGEAKESFRNGIYKPSITAEILSEVGQLQSEAEQTALEDVAIGAMGSAFAAASDTTTVTLLNFVLAMLLYPRVQTAAQKELDDTVGKGRLPEIADKDALPYITAVMYECLRWRPPIPLGIPHRSMGDDEYNGFHIPAGSIVIGNAWAILHDPARYPHPETFSPERFLDADGALRADMPEPLAAFGYGRRICPGRYFAYDLVWLAIASILAAFDIAKPVDENGRVVEPSGEYTSGIFSFPVPFEADFKKHEHIDISE